MAKITTSGLLRRAHRFERATLFLGGLLFLAVALRQRQTLKGLLHSAQAEQFVDPFQLLLPFAILNVAQHGGNMGRQVLLLGNEIWQEMKASGGGHS